MRAARVRGAQLFLDLILRIQIQKQIPL